MGELLSTRDMVDKYGLMAKKTLGQNFLLDANIPEKIVRLMLNELGKDNLNDECFVEIGPGPGGLTRAVLAKVPEKMTVIEMDERCLMILDEIKLVYPMLSVISGDALRVDYESMARDKKINIISNLPYNISVVLLTMWLKNLAQIKSMTLMFQKEVADRIMAHVGTKDYGRLSIFCQLMCDVKKLFDLPPTCFVPAPKIWSSVLFFLPKNDLVEPDVLIKIEKLTEATFSKRRKMIRQSLKGVNGALEVAVSLGIDLTLRAEDLTPLDYLHIAERLV